MRAMEKLVTDGLVEFIGVSNFNVEELQAAQEALRDKQIACNQILYHLGYRAIERRLLPYCTEHKIAIVGYAPFGHGNFPPPDSAAGRLLTEIAGRHGRTSRQVALNYLTRHRNVFTIPKTTHPERARENSGGTGWKLSEEDVLAIEMIFPVQENDTLQMI